MRLDFLEHVPCATVREKIHGLTNFLTVHGVSVCHVLPAFGTCLCLTTVRNSEAASQYKKFASQENLPQFTVNSFAHAAQVQEDFCWNERETFLFHRNTCNLGGLSRRFLSRVVGSIRDRLAADSRAMDANDAVLRSAVSSASRLSSSLLSSAS